MRELPATPQSGGTESGLATAAAAAVEATMLAIMTISQPIADAKFDVFFQFWRNLNIDMAVICMNDGKEDPLKSCDHPSFDQQFKFFSGKNKIILHLQYFPILLGKIFRVRSRAFSESLKSIF